MRVQLEKQRAIWNFFQAVGYVIDILINNQVTRGALKEGTALSDENKASIKILRKIELSYTLTSNFTFSRLSATSAGA
jgi:hypothetical protein